mgnify:CR=1 FL=1
MRDVDNRPVHRADLRAAFDARLANNVVRNARQTAELLWLADPRSAVAPQRRAVGLNPEGELSFGPITKPIRSLITLELPAPGVENSAQPSTPQGQLVPFAAPLLSELDLCDDPAWPLEASKEDREAGVALPVPPVPDSTGPIDGFESPSFDGGSPHEAEESDPEEAESPEEQGPLSAAPSTSVGIATPELLPPADTTTTIATSATLRARFYAAHPERLPSVSQERKAPPPKAPPGYEGPQQASPPVRAFPRRRRRSDHINPCTTTVKCCTQHLCRHGISGEFVPTRDARRRPAPTFLAPGQTQSESCVENVMERLTISLALPF